MAEIDHTVAEKKIILYGTPACSMIPTVRNMLQRAGADFEYVDIYKVLEARERVREINHGYESVPTLVFPDDSTLTEPSSGDLKTKLENLGYEVQSPTGMGWLQLIFQHPLVRILGVVFVITGMLGEIYWLMFLGVIVLALGLLIGRLRS